MLRHRLIAFCALILLIGATARASIIIDNFTSATNDRFANDGSFILSGHDLSGLGRSSDGKWATLISNNVFISATHAHPGVSSTLTFYASNDPTGASITRTVTSGQRIGSTDLWVGVLDTPVSSTYTSYALLTQDIADSSAFASADVNSAIGYMVGRSPTEWADPLQDMAIGTNVIDLWVEDSTAGGSTDDALSAIYQLGANDLTYEALLQGGDSGAPLFVTDSASLYIAGVNWWVGDGDITVGMTTTNYDLSGFSYVGNYNAALTSFISTHAVPEPSSFAGLLGLGVLAWTASRRRRALK